FGPRRTPECYGCGSLSQGHVLAAELFESQAALTSWLEQQQCRTHCQTQWRLLLERPLSFRSGPCPIACLDGVQWFRAAPVASRRLYCILLCLALAVVREERST